MKRLDPQPIAPSPALLLVLGLTLFLALACGGLGSSDGGGDEADIARASGLAAGDAAIDEAIASAVRQQEARDAMVVHLKGGDAPSRTSEVDDAWRAAFGASESSPPRGRR